MIARSHLRAADRSRRDDALVWLALGMGCVALAVRQVGQAGFLVTMGAGAIGLMVSSGQSVSAEREWTGGSRPALSSWTAAVVLGLAAFAVARAMVLLPPEPIRSVALAGNVVAAVAEEAFFRRFLYARLERWGAVVAVVGSAAAFALVHVPGYGIAALPLDLGAGVLLSWQRWATGRWEVPAATHLLANLLAAIP
jgi:membrane protease YdiL (CAAX protease family)